jgi:DNA-binding CsgD family transcriptional regulator
MSSAPNPIELRQLRFYLTVVEELHLGRAADRLRISQPRLSNMLRRLEERLDVELLVRTGRGVIPTQAGLAFAREARSVVSRFEPAVGETSRARGGAVGTAQVAGSTRALRGLLHGRDAERAALTILVDDARRSKSGVLVVRGEAGIGKSALLADTIEHAAGVRVLRATGAESEADLAFAGLHQFLRPAFDRIDELGAPQAAALRSAFGMAPPDGADPFLVGVGVLSLLALVAEDLPVLGVLDDAHWLDESSAAAIAFAARRLEAERIALVFAARDDEPRTFDARGRLPELRLAGLDSTAAGSLLAEAAGPNLALDVRARLIDYADGNPLALLELPRALNREQLAGRALLTDPPPVTRCLEDAFRVRDRELPDAARLLLLVAAADDTRESAVVLRTARALGVGSADIEAVEAAGLLRVAGHRVEFRHPLVRAIAYHAAPPAQRRAVHLALADALPGESEADRRAWHLASAATDPDDAVAEALERSAGRARTRRGWTGAAAALTRAAALTTSDRERTRRQLAAAQAAGRAGRPELALALLADAHTGAVEPALVADVELLRGSIELDAGTPRAAYEILREAALRIVDADPQRAATLLLDAGSAARYAGDLPAQIEVGCLAEALIGTAGAIPELLVSAGLGLLWSGDSRGRARLEASIGEAAASHHPHSCLPAAIAALHLGNDAAARRLAMRATALARSEGAVPKLVTTLSRLAFAEIAEGSLAAARANASEGLALATDAGLSNDAWYHRALLAWVDALTGHPEDARANAEAVLGSARAHGCAWQVAVAQFALGELELAHGQPREAMRAFQQLAPLGSAAAHPYLAARAAPSVVEAAMRAGRRDVAVEALARYEQWAHLSGDQPARNALLARSRALLECGAAARPLFEEAIRLHVVAQTPWERARTELLFGTRLRRDRQRRAAREHLRVAQELFVEAGSASGAERAQAELRATGETLRPTHSMVSDDLTPQELQIARAVAAGATNKEVAGQLFLSPRTVDAHLRSIFRKLRITSRTELATIRKVTRTE